MHITLISNITPASENIRGTSALPYHLLLHRDKDLEVTIYTYNLNELSEEKIAEVKKELNVDIYELKQPLWIYLLFKLHLLILRLFIPYPIHSYIKLGRMQLDKIKRTNPDAIWVYGEEMYHVVKQFDGYKCVHTLPDCESLYYYRMLKRRFVTSSRSFYFRIGLMYPKFLRMERSFSNEEHVIYHVVGMADVEHLRENNPNIKAVFVPHPHYFVKSSERKIHFHKPKIRLLIAGQNNIYMRHDANIALTRMCREKLLAQYYDITFVGRWWNNHVEKMIQAGYNVNHILFAPNYIEEICQHDIQLTPISIGTGTKGKVLDAMANGLLVLGTRFAYENITIPEEAEKCCYNDVDELIELLYDIPQNIEKYESIAENTRKMIVEEHSAAEISKNVFRLFLM